MRLPGLILLALIITVIAACAGKGPPLPEDADFSGVIAEFPPFPESPDFPARLLVNRPDPGSADRTIVHVGPRTDIRIVQSGGAARPATAEELRTGDEVRVWTTGVELRSYPGQVFAVRIEVLR